MFNILLLLTMYLNEKLKVSKSRKAWLILKLWFYDFEIVYKKRKIADTLSRNSINKINTEANDDNPIKT